MVLRYFSIPSQSLYTRGIAASLLNRGAYETKQYVNFVITHTNFVVYVIYVGVHRGGRGYWALYYTSPQSFLIC